MIDIVLRDLGVSRDCAVMIGDSEADVGAARAAQLRSIVLAHGYRGGVVVGALGADSDVASFAELPTALEAMLPARFVVQHGGDR